jgi:hypothetical protein
MKTTQFISLVAGICLMGANLFADENETPNLDKKESVTPLKMSGFRIGVSVMGGSKAAEFKAAMHDSRAAPIISQFGWQYEFRFPAGEGGMAAVVEIIGLVGGLNQGLFIPSINLPIGIRSASGFEIGAGPHFSMGGLGNNPKLASGFVVAGGLTKKFGKLNIPLNFAFMQGRTRGEAKAGYTLTMLTGFAF